MILEKLQASLQITTWLAMTLVSLGLLLVVIGTAFSHLGAQTQIPGWEDFARGLFFGMGMALETLGLLAMASAVRQRGRA